MRNLKTGVQFENRYRATEDVEVAYLKNTRWNISTTTGPYHFMNQENYEQSSSLTTCWGDAIKYYPAERRRRDHLP